MGVLSRAEPPLTVRAVVAELNARRAEPLAYTTVMTVMTRLAGKRVLARSRRGRPDMYAPPAAGTADNAVPGGLEGVGGSAPARFVERAEVDSRLRDRLKRLMGPDR